MVRGLTIGGHGGESGRLTQSKDHPSRCIEGFSFLEFGLLGEGGWLG